MQVIEIFNSIHSQYASYEIPIFILLHVVMAILFLPCSPLTIIAGVIWGNFYGTIISVVASLASIAATFLISKYCIKTKVEKIISAKFPSLVQKLSQAAIFDWKLIAFVQMNPLFPASTMGYAFGLTGIGIYRYILLSAIFMVPSHLFCTSLGSLSLNVMDHPIYIFYVVLLLYVAHIARRIFNYYYKFF